VRSPGQALRGGMGGGPVSGSAGGGSEGLPTLNIKELERLTIERALESSGGNKTHAAKLLGLSRRGLLKKLERYRDDGAPLDE